MPEPNDQPLSTAAIFPLLCVVIALVLLSSMPIYRGLESSFSAEHGLGAAMVMLRDELEENEEVAVFLGLTPDDEGTVVAVNADLPPEATQARFDLAAAVEAYIAQYTPRQVMPLDGTITSPYGVRVDPFWSGGLRTLGTAPTEPHYGLDISAAKSTDIVAAMAGTVCFVGHDVSYGNYVILTHDDCETLYAHCAAIDVVPGQRVQAGEHIAVAGATGRATGVHLHFEVRVDGCSVDPLAYLGAGSAA